MSEVTQTSLKKPGPSAKQLIERLRFELCNGHFAPGSRFFSNNTLAREFGISAPTAGKILDTLCKEGLLERVHGSGTYVTEQAGKRRVTAYAFITWLEAGNPHLSKSKRFQVLAYFERLCIEEGRSVQIINLDNADYLQRLNQLLAAGLDGVVLLPPFGIPSMREVITTLKNTQVPVVYWADINYSIGIEKAVQIQFDGFQCGRIATEHLLALGHKTIVAIYRREDESWQKSRLEGYKAALTKAKLSKLYQIIEITDTLEMAANHLHSHLQNLKATGYTAIFASNDALARELILTGQTAGFSFPGDFSIIGVDNNTDALLSGITTVELSAESMAKTAFTVLENWSKTRDRYTTTVPCRLIIRSSTGQVSRKVIFK